MYDPHNPYRQYWSPSPTPTPITQVNEQPLAPRRHTLARLRGMVRAGLYRDDVGNAEERRLAFQRWLYTTGRMSEYPNG